MGSLLESVVSCGEGHRHESGDVMKVDASGGVGAVANQGGMNAEAMLLAVEESLDKTRVGSWKGLPLSDPPDVTGLPSVVLDEVFAFIMEDQTQVDYPKRTAFVDPDTKQFYLKVEGNTGIQHEG